MQMDSKQGTPVSSPPKKRPLVDLIISIVIPSVILMKFSGEDHLGPVNGLLVALAFPISYFLVELIVDRRPNFISILGFLSVLLTGGVGLLKLDPAWIAVKEASIPAIIGIVILGSLQTKYPLVRKMIYNDSIIDTQKVAASLEVRKNQSAFDRLLTVTTYLLSGSFFVSATLNFVLATIIVKTSPELDPVAFNEEIGRMAALSYPVIAIPSMIMLAITLWILIRGIKQLTGLGLEEIFQTPPK